MILCPGGGRPSEGASSGRDPEELGGRGRVGRGGRPSGHVPAADHRHRPLPAVGHDGEGEGARLEVPQAHHWRSVFQGMFSKPRSSRYHVMMRYK